jgi:hypothetical protein
MLRHAAFTRTVGAMLLISAVVRPLAARLIEGGKTFQEMFDKADLVVIATGIKSKDTTERTKLKDVAIIETMPPEEWQDEVIGVETEFYARVTLKGPKDVKTLLLHHYRLAVEDKGGGGPQLIDISSLRHGDFLMFLVKEKDGRYAPVTGQFDAAVLSVLKLNAATSDQPVW